MPVLGSSSLPRIRSVAAIRASTSPSSTIAKQVRFDSELPVEIANYRIQSVQFTLRELRMSN